MLVDFCHWSVKTVVTCSSVSSDGYDVDNLISKNFVLKNKGFLAERFLKPPVSITFTFPCSINIYQVIINPVIGYQKSSDLELLTKINMTPIILGKIAMNNPSVVCFFNPSFQAKYPYSVEDSDLTRFQYVVEMKNRYATSLVSHLTIRIIRTFDSLIPGIRSVCIFGQPSNKYSKDIHKEIFTLYAQSLNHQSPPSLSFEKSSMIVTSKQAVETVAESKASSNSCSNFEVPEEFVDPITCEVMALPTLLPSGKSVDHNTLERYTENEAMYGRRPNDPFTGVAFNAENFPVPNSSLKVRIDQFLLQHGDEELVKRAPRTVGRKEDEPKIIGRTQDVFRTLDRKQDVSSDSKLYNAHIQSNATSKTSDSSLKNSIVKRKTCLDTFGDKIKVPRLESRKDNSMLPSNCLSAHKTILDNSLDDAMSILEQLPSFTSAAPASLDCNSTSMSQEKLCVKCQTKISTSAMYQLVCNHCICRLCLFGQFGQDATHLVKCSKCKQVCNRNDVSRIFQ